MNALQKEEPRHSCQHSHKLQNWGWLEFDGTDYGLERIGDNVQGVVSKLIFFLNKDTLRRGKPYNIYPYFNGRIFQFHCFSICIGFNGGMAAVSLSIID